jgi:hypothetical protein
MATVPPDGDSLSRFPLSDILAHYIDDSSNLVARNPWILDARE